MAKTRAALRRDAAEEVCWSLLLMMEFGGLEIPMEWRKFLSRTYEPWAELAVVSGLLRPAPYTETPE